MIRLETKNCNTILPEKEQKYQHCNQVKLMNMNILSQILSSSRILIIEQAKYTYTLRKALEKERKKLVDNLKSLKLKTELNQIERICPKNQSNDLMIDKLK